MKRKKQVFFAATQFTATRWATAEEKATFANNLASFVVGGCLLEHFTAALYKQLSHMFSHIAHYDRDGFAHVWFETPKNRSDWIHHLLDNVSYGAPNVTWSDVEEAFVQWLRERRELARFHFDASEDEEKKERAELARLQAKYGNDS
jgi:hypothetical protein